MWRGSRLATATSGPLKAFGGVPEKSPKPPHQTTTGSDANSVSATKSATRIHGPRRRERSIEAAQTVDHGSRLAVRGEKIVNFEKYFWTGWAGLRRRRGVILPCCGAVRVLRCGGGFRAVVGVGVVVRGLRFFGRFLAEKTATQLSNYFNDFQICIKSISLSLLLGKEVRERERFIDRR